MNFTMLFFNHHINIFKFKDKELHFQINLAKKNLNMRRINT